MSEKATLRIRFILNQRTGASEIKRSFQRAGQQFAGMIIRDVGLRVAEASYRRLVSQIRGELTRDIQQEIENIARLYTRHVIGRSGARNREITLQAQTTTTKDQVSFGNWKPLARNTTNRKGHSKFFLDKAGLGRQMNRGSIWEHSFGPVMVRVTRTKSNVEDQSNLYKDWGGRSVRFSVAKVSVTALGRITSDMLPELGSGVISYNGYPSGRQTGLVNLVSDDSARLKIGNWGRNGKGAYRPTLEPFLAFALTRAIPKAVERRITRRNGEYPGGTRRIR